MSGDFFLFLRWFLFHTPGPFLFHTPNPFLFHTPRLRRTPLKRGRRAGAVGLLLWLRIGCGEGLHGMSLPLNTIAACTNPPLRPPLFRGVGGMSLPLDAIVAYSNPPLRPPLFRGAGGMSHSLAFVHTPFYFHTPGPFQKGRAGAVGLVLWLRMGCGEGWRGWYLALNTIAVCSDPLPRPPLFRGVGGMSHSLAFVHTPFYFHTPGPFQKGRAGAVLVFH